MYEYLDTDDQERHDAHRYWSDKAGDAYAQLAELDREARFEFIDPEFDPELQEESDVLVRKLRFYERKADQFTPLMTRVRWVMWNRTYPALRKLEAEVIAGTSIDDDDLPWERTIAERMDTVKDCVNWICIHEDRRGTWR